MPRSNEILNELEQLSMVVAGISRNLPYEAPEGYFSEFPAKMVARLEPNALEDAPSPNWGKSPTMSVPEGYFESFASRMMDKIRERSVRQEMQEDEKSPLLDRIGKNMPYQVPEGYFDNSLPATVLLGLKDKIVYEVPEGYFETLAEIIVARVHPAETRQASGKLVSMGSRSRTTWWKYAAAAVMTGVMLTFGWLRFQSNPKQPQAGVDVSQGLAKVSDQDLQNYVEDHTQQIQQVQQEEDYANSTASLDISDNDVKNLLGDVPDGDLTEYMEEHGSLQDYPTN